MYLSHAMRDIMEHVQDWLDSGEQRIVLATVVRTFKVEHLNPQVSPRSLPLREGQTQF